MLTMDTTSFAGKKALVRVDLNVPQDANGRVTDDSRARAIVRTVNKDHRRWRQRHPHEPLGPSQRQGEPGDEPQARSGTPQHSAASLCSSPPTVWALTPRPRPLP